MRVLTASLASFAALAIAACSAAPKSTFTDGTDPNFAVDSGDPNNGNPNLGDGGSTPPPAGDCTDAAKLVYVIGNTGDLYSFNPATLVFTRIGNVNCGGQVNSMAVSRDGTAWVNLDDGSLVKVNTATAACQKTNYKLDQGMVKIKGMGFSADTAGGSAETLYTCAINNDPNSFDFLTGVGLYKINMPSLTLAPIGDFGGTLNGAECELTGTGDARLFGDYALIGKFAEINKSTGKAISPSSLTGVPSNINQFAFSFWGGDFWFYTDASTGHSAVTRYKYATDKTFAKVATAPISIVGAGVSTCAPTTPPN